jgi:hypothetical protein
MRLPKMLDTDSNFFFAATSANMNIEKLDIIVKISQLIRRPWLKKPINPLTAVGVANEGSGRSSNKEHEKDHFEVHC